MKWMNTQEFVSMLKRFPNKRIEVSSYLGSSIASIHCWEYSQNTKGFIHHIGTTYKYYSETELIRLYSSQHWKVKPFFSLKDNQEKRLAVRMIEELIMLGHLDDIISEYEIDNVRVCEHCHHLMIEGWLVDDIRTFCSDECLLYESPNICISELNAHSLDADCLAYWTKWEEDVAP